MKSTVPTDSLRTAYRFALPRQKGQQAQNRIAVTQASLHKTVITCSASSQNFEAPSNRRLRGETASNLWQTFSIVVASLTQ
jgi:hypothetical protein